MSQSIPQQRINKLFAEARRIAPDNQGLADRYMAIAWAIKLQTNTALTPKQRLSFCKACKQYIAPSDHHVRLNDGVLTQTCPHCNNYRRVRYDTN